MLSARVVPQVWQVVVAAVLGVLGSAIGLRLSPSFTGWVVVIGVLGAAVGRLVAIPFVAPPPSLPEARFGVGRPRHVAEPEEPWVLPSRTEEPSRALDRRFRTR